MNHENIRQAIRKPATKPVEENPWPFASPPNEAVISIKAIVTGEKSILYVVHDASDGGWQFLSGEAFSEADASIVSLKTMLKVDATIAALHDLPEGWGASRRATSEPWTRFKMPVE